MYLYGSDINVSERCFILKVGLHVHVHYESCYTVQCSLDQTSAAEGSLRQGRLKYNSSSGKIKEFEQNC